MKALEDLKEVLEDQIKKITKKNDITPAELENVKKALEVMAMTESLSKEKEKGQEESKQSQMGGQSMGQSMASNHYPMEYMNPMYQNAYARGNSNAYAMGSQESRGSYDGSYERGQSNARDSYARDGMSNERGGVYMGSYDGSYARDSYARDSYARDNYSGNSYERGQSNERDMSNEQSRGRRGRDGDSDGRYSERRGRDERGRYTSRDMSNEYGQSSRHTEKERMVEKLEDMLDDAKTDRERKTIAKCIDKIDR